MKQKYKTLILNYCESNAVLVPPGFARNSSWQYVVIRTDKVPAKYR